MINPRILGVPLLAIAVAASAMLVATGFQNAMATAQLQPLPLTDSIADVDVAEAEEAGNTPMVTNQTTTSGNTPAV